MAMEEDVMNGKTQGFKNGIMPIRKELLTLRGYYEELMDFGKELEENENDFFAKKATSVFWCNSRPGRTFKRKNGILVRVCTTGKRCIPGTGGCGAK